MAQALHKVRIQRIYPPSSNGTAVLVGNDEKTFIVFIGLNEATALLREMKNEPAPRPLTHDLLQSVFLGFDVGVKQIIISDIVDNAFCATLILEQQGPGASEDPNGHRAEVRIDARPSDCFVLALKNATDLYVTADVMEQVRDFSQLLEQDESALDELAGEEAFERGMQDDDDLFGNPLEGDEIDEGGDESEDGSPDDFEGDFGSEDSGRSR
ncbi:MAG: bifunctional nuclease family protein [Planctomycetota bacterium]